MGASARGVHGVRRRQTKCCRPCFPRASWCRRRSRPSAISVRRSLASPQPRLVSSSPECRCRLVVAYSAHLNLRDVHEPYKHLIGQVLLDVGPAGCGLRPWIVYMPNGTAHGAPGCACLQKNSKVIRTVVNKVDAIDTQFRFFKMEVLAGEPDTNAVVVRRAPNTFIARVCVSTVAGRVRAVRAAARERVPLCVRLCQGVLELAAAQRAQAPRGPLHGRRRRLCVRPPRYSVARQARRR